MDEVGEGLERGGSGLFKSELERQVARLFERSGIAYRYEYPLAVMDRGKVRVWYPDFQLPEYGILVECVGVRGEKRYNAQLEHKRKVYTEMGIPVIFLGLDSFRGYWPRRVVGSIEGILRERLVGFLRRTRELPDWREEAGRV